MGRSCSETYLGLTGEDQELEASAVGRERKKKKKGERSRGGGRLGFLEAKFGNFCQEKPTPRHPERAAYMERFCRRRGCMVLAETPPVLGHERKAGS